MSESVTLYFTTRVGLEKNSIPFPVSTSMKFIDVISEVCKKIGIHQQSLSLATPGGIVLTANDLLNTVNNIVNEFGTSFEVIDQGIVG